MHISMMAEVAPGSSPRPSILRNAMIRALRKIEGRGELPRATSAIMEMCIDNPREGFADIFSTHPSVETRIKALVRYAGGHDPGPLALQPEPDPSSAPQASDTSREATPAPTGPWNNPAPASPNADPTPVPDASAPGPDPAGSWGPH